MPIRKVKGGFKWGSHGHVYKNRAGAERQAAAAHANGFRGDAADLKAEPAGNPEAEQIGQTVHRLEPEADDE